MTQEALKLALDALENLKHKIRYENEQDEIGSSICCDELSFKPHSEDCKLINAITAIKKALAQPEQEPVAWVSEDVCKGQYIDGRPRKIWWECEKNVGAAFYTDPPQRKWLGLFDEEIEVLFQTAAGADEEVHIRFARAIESKMKELNT